MGTRDRDSAPASSWTPVRSVLEERLVRTPALEMEDLLSSVRLSLTDGPWWDWSPGVLDVPPTSLESTLMFLSSEIGLIPTKTMLLLLITTSRSYNLFILYLTIKNDVHFY